MISCMVSSLMWILNCQGKCEMLTNGGSPTLEF